VHTLIVYGEEDVSWSPIFPVVLDFFTGRSSEVKILDTSEFAYPKFKSPSNWILRKYGFSSSSSYLEGAKKKHSVITLNHQRLSRPVSVILSVSEWAELKRSVEGLLMTLFADFRPERHRVLYPALKKRAERSAVLLFHAALESMLKDRPTKIVIPNGRFPYQKALVLAAKRLEVEVAFYERGFRTDSGVFIGEHMTVDRRAWQAIAERGDERFGESTRRASRQWLLSRKVPGSLDNEFSSNWRLDSTHTESTQTPTTRFSVAFFTSSQDEFLSLEDWQGFGWSDQYEAFTEFARRVEGPHVLRIHPNFINKSFGHAIEEIRRVNWMRKNVPGLEIVWPTSPLSSYQVIDQSAKIVVHGSTIGLEASAYGKPVWNSGSSMYDIYGDVRNFLPNSNYPDSFFQNWEVDPRRAEAIVDAQISADIPIPEESVQRRWNAQSIPLIVRLLNLVNSVRGLYFLVLVGRTVSIRLNKALVWIFCISTRRRNFTRLLQGKWAKVQIR
jgi:hypothetical protein